MNLRILKALIKKETLQITRDPSAILIAFILPLILLFIFGYGVNLDSNQIKVGMAIEDEEATAFSLIEAFRGSPFMVVELGKDQRDFYQQLESTTLRGIIIIPQDFSRRWKAGNEPRIQVITDGSEPNLATFVTNYSRGIISLWMQEQFKTQTGKPFNGIQVDPRFWYNPELRSRNFLIPGSIAIVMTLIGTLLTALVIAREWERGTMEAMLATPVTNFEILLGKLIPYFILGMGSMVLCLVIAIFLFDVPFRGSLSVLALTTAVFLFAGLGQGMLISSVTGDQFVASQAALMSAFLPAFMLSGFIFEISAMPVVLQKFTYLFAARYFVTALQSIFLVGNVWPLLLQSMLAMALIATVFYLITAKNTKKRLD